MKPRATEKKRDIYKTARVPDVRTGRIEKTKIHVGTEVRRRTRCPQCHQRTENFEGVNDNGWIFRCAGSGEKTADDPGYLHMPYLFTAEPAPAPVT